MMESLAGFVIAIAVGMTGMGGGALMAPALILFFGVPAVEAVGTSLLFVTVTKMVAAPMYIVRKSVDWKTLGRLLLGGLPGVLAGSLLLGRLSKRNLEPAVLTLVGSTIVVIAGLTLARMLWGKRAMRGTDRPRVLPLATFPIGLEVGFSSAGAGALGSLLLMNATTLEASTIVGTDMLFGWAVAMLGGGVHFAMGGVDMALAGKLIAGGVFGALAGSWLATWLPSRTLRYALTGFLVFLGGQLLWKGIGGL
jgi:hypothetical protein